MAKKTSSEVAQDIYTEVTAKIIAQLEKGVRPWEKPWKAHDAGAVLPVRHNGEGYHGINVLLLWIAQMEKNYDSNQWMGFNQAKALGGTVRKGEKGTAIVYWGSFVPQAEKKSAQDENRDPEKIMFLKQTYVWNVCQIDALPARYYPEEIIAVTDEEKHRRIDAAEAFFKTTGSRVIHGGGRAFYATSDDSIHIPNFEAFHEGPESYYATLGHEHIHWTGAKQRLNRDLLNRFGTQAYAAEELIAEIGSAFLCARLGITSEVREDHAGYIANWIEVLKNDNRFIMQAASAATKAVKFLAGEIATIKESEEVEEAA